MTNKRILSGDEAKAKYEEIKANGLLLFEAVVGSVSYGTNIEGVSDVDLKFVYIDTLEDFMSDNATEQLNVTDDYTGYEIGRYLELLQKQNPNIQELINADERHIMHCHPAFREIVMDRRQELLSKKVAYSYATYAYSQIKKAQGTNKKFMNPMPKERQTLLDFCWSAHKQGSIRLTEAIDLVCPSAKKFPEWIFGVSALDHMKNCYNLYFCLDTYNKVEAALEKQDDALMEELYARRKYNGIIDQDGVQIKMSNIERGDNPILMFYCNIEGFSKYCKDYKEYWEWVENRNIHRFVENASNKDNFDTKNMMHCHRLLDMCKEILTGQGVIVYRPNREELLNIRLGKRKYQELVDSADVKIAECQALYETSALPEECDHMLVKHILSTFRKNFYGIQ